jgi:TetR/AcrR family transcriptional regulator
LTTTAGFRSQRDPRSKAAIRLDGEARRAAAANGKLRRAKSPRRERQIAAKRTAILDAALMLFSRSSLHGTSLEKIAEAADVSKSNLFYYFDSKEAIYVAVLERLLEEWLAPLRALKLGGDPVEALRDYIRQKILFSRTNPDASRLFCLEMIHGAPHINGILRSSLKDLVHSKAKVLQAWSRRGALAGIDPYHLIFSIWAVTQHYADFAVQVKAFVGRDLSDEAFLEQTIGNVQKILLDGALPRLAPPARSLRVRV